MHNSSTRASRFLVHFLTSTARLRGEGKRQNEFAEWHVAWLWHGLRNDIIMRNAKYGNWRKEIN